MRTHAPLDGLFDQSRLMILDFTQIPSGTPDTQNIAVFFKKCEAERLNPRLPENRQKFNNSMLKATGARYLVSRYGEDRKAMLTGSVIAEQGRTLHMGIDIFSKEQETVYAPCDGTIVRAAYEEQSHGYGHYVMLQSEEDPKIYFFLGHLSKDLPKLGPVKAGDPIAVLGDYHNEENGGWSRHLHLQIATYLPSKGTTPDGYSTAKDFPTNSTRCPDPMPFFPDWHVKQ